MQVVSLFEARESFNAVLDRLAVDADVTLITRRLAQGAVVMSPTCSAPSSRPNAGS